MFQVWHMALQTACVFEGLSSDTSLIFSWFKIFWTSFIFTFLFQIMDRNEFDTKENKN